MNISPDSIEAYKQQMMNAYRSSPTRATSTTTSNMATARNLAVSVPQPQVSSAAPTIAVPEPVSSETEPAVIEDAISLNNAIEANELDLFDAATEAEEQIFTPYPPGNNGAGVPDTGYIEVPKYPGIPDTQPASPPPTTPTPNPPKPNPPKPKPPSKPIKPPSSQPSEGIGYLRTQAYTGNRAIPVVGALIIITEHRDGKVHLVRIMSTDDSGYTDTIPLAVPEYDPEKYPDPATRPYRDYRISAFAEGFYILNDVPVPIYAGVKSLQPIALVPLRENEDKINYLPKPLDEILTEVGVDPADVPQAAGITTPDKQPITVAPTGSVG